MRAKLARYTFALSRLSRKMQDTPEFYRVKEREVFDW
jgi:hypothetical protein